MSQQRFFELLSRQPRIETLWDRKNQSLNLEAFDHALGVMSSGEVSSLDTDGRKLIMEWIARPFWP